MKSNTDETLGLRHCVRDLAALSALSASWSGADIPEIACGLADVFLRILPVEFVYVRALGGSEPTVHYAVHAQQGVTGAARAEQMGEAFDLILKPDSGDGALVAADPFGHGQIPLAVVQIGFEGNCGLLIAGSRQWDFPTATDTLLLHVGANQAATVLQYKKSQEYLRQSETRLRLFIEHAPAAIAMLDRDMRYIAVSRRWLVDYRIHETTVIGRSHYEFFNEESHCGKKLHMNCLAGAVEKCDDDHFERNDGTRDAVHWEIHPWRDSHGEIGGIVIFSEVITEKKRAEEALKEADRRKDEFLATVAHELRNPLAPIRNAVQILRVRGLPETESQWARDVIDRQAHLMTRLVDDLLDLSRISRGRLSVHKERINLATVINTAVETSRPNIAKWGHELTISMPAEPIYLDADPTRLEQVLLNLLNNAAKYTPQSGHIWLTIQVHGAEVAIRIKDNGIGIPPDKLPFIFEIFAQVNRSLGRSHEGLGIGLALVQQLVKLHGGTIEAHSTGIAGRGSEFIMRLPIVPGYTPGPNTKPAVTAAAPSKYRILVVDDNKDAANCLAKLLRKSGNEVHTANDGLEAVEAAAAFQPDLVLLDIGLPKLDGYEVARRIRAQPRSHEIVFIAVTGWGQEEDRRLSRDAGFAYHLIKPIETEVLQRLLAGLDPVK